MAAHGNDAGLGGSGEHCGVKHPDAGSDEVLCGGTECCFAGLFAAAVAYLARLSLNNQRRRQARHRQTEEQRNLHLRVVEGSPS